MARGKKGRKSASVIQPTPKPQNTKKVETPSTPRRKFAFWEYLVVCLFFIVFCYVQKYFALIMLVGWDNTLTIIKQGAEDVHIGIGHIEKLSLDFFFDTLWKGFIIVSILVWLHDLFYRDVEAKEREMV